MTSLPTHYRRNFLAFTSDYIGFALAMTFVGSTTVLPDFVGRLTDSEIAVGLVGTISTGAWLLPQLFFANLLTAKRRKKPYVLLGAAFGRPLYLLYAAALLLGLHHRPTLAVALLFGVQLLFFGSDALASVAWFDMLGKAIPERRRGRLVGVAQFISGVLAFGGGALIAALLSKRGPAFPQNYAVIFGLAGVSLLFSFTSICFIVEPDEPVEERRPKWKDYVSHLFKTLRQDRAFARLILVRLLAGADTLALGFYILFATRELGLPDATVGWFNAAQTLGRFVASVGLATLAERVGSHRVVQVSTAITLTAPLLGLALLLSGARGGTALAVVYAWVFVTIGVTISASMLGFYNHVLALAPPGQRPTYIGVFNTISGVLIVLPTVGGWILRTASYGVLFALTAALLVVAHGLSWSLLPTQARTEMLPLLEASTERTACAD